MTLPSPETTAPVGPDLVPVGLGSQLRFPVQNADGVAFLAGTDLSNRYVLAGLS